MRIGQLRAVFKTTAAQQNALCCLEILVAVGGLGTAADDFLGQGVLDKLHGTVLVEYFDARSLDFIGQQVVQSQAAQADPVLVDAFVHVDAHEHLAVLVEDGGVVVGLGIKVEVRVIGGQRVVGNVQLVKPIGNAKVGMGPVVQQVLGGNMESQLTEVTGVKLLVVHGNPAGTAAGGVAPALLDRSSFDDKGLCTCFRSCEGSALTSETITDDKDFCLGIPGLGHPSDLVGQGGARGSHTSNATCHQAGILQETSPRNLGHDVPPSSSCERPVGARPIELGAIMCNSNGTAHPRKAAYSAASEAVGYPAIKGQAIPPIAVFTMLTSHFLTSHPLMQQERV